MEPSLYQETKLLLISAFGLPREAFHLLIGLVVHLAACLLFRRPLAWSGGLVAAVAVAVLLELPDLRDDMASLGRPRWSASGVDLLHTALAPLLIILSERLRSWRGAGRARRT